MPSYKFALSSALIDSVDTVIQNNSESKEWARLKHVQSQAFTKASPRARAPAVKTSRIIAQAASQEESQASISADESASKRPPQNYDSRKPFHQ